MGLSVRMGSGPPPQANFLAQRFICFRETKGGDLEAKTGDRGWGGGNKGERKDCPWIERRQMWPIGKWQFIVVKGDPRVKMRCLIFTDHVN